MNLRYQSYDPFILAQNVRQVYYAPYPSYRRDKRDWCVVIQTKPRGRIESNDTQDDAPFQVDQMSHANQVIEVERISQLHDFNHEFEEIEDNDEQNDEDQEEDDEEEDDEEDEEQDDDDGDDDDEDKDEEEEEEEEDDDSDDDNSWFMI